MRRVVPVLMALLLAGVTPVATATGTPPPHVSLPDAADEGNAEPPPFTADEPALNVTFDLPREANGGEIILVTIHVDVEDGAAVRNVTIRANVHDAYVVLPGWRHDGWRGGDLAWHVDEVNGSASVFFHVKAPATPAPLETTFTASASADGRVGEDEQVVTVRSANDADPGRAPLMALVAVGYVATLTAPPALDDILA